MANDSQNRPSSAWQGVARFFWVGCFSALAAVPVQAITLVTERANLGANDQLDWQALFTTVPFTPLSSNFSTTSAGGLGLSVSIPPPVPPTSNPFIFQTGPVIPTNFGFGDYILFTGLNFANQTGNPGPISLTFATPVYGVGAQLLPDAMAPGPFTGFISAFDSSGTLLGTFAAVGNVSTALDNSALFLGVQSDLANISRITFSTDVPSVAIGINRLSLLSVPEPPPATLLALGSLLFFWRRRRHA